MFATWISILIALENVTGVPTPGPTPSGPVYVGDAAARMTLESRPLGFDPDGNARWAIVVHFVDAQNKPTRILLGSDLEYRQNRGSLQWQTRMRFGQPAAIVSTTDDGPLSMTVKANVPALADAQVESDTRRWRGPRVVAGVLGPHLVQLGWFPKERSVVRILRLDARGQRVSIVVSAPSSTYRDTTVQPGKTYRYVVSRQGRAPDKIPAVRVMPELPPDSIGALRGKGMWLSFSINPAEDGYYGKIDPKLLVAQAVKSGLHYVELRTAYGEFWEAQGDAKTTIDAIVDGLAAKGIGVIGWTVPRQASFEDVQMSVKTAAYRTARGTTLAGLAVDLERGEEFMHDCPEGCAAIANYVTRLRSATGANYKIVATVEDPYLENLDNNKYPYAIVARSVDVLQPMAYWRMLSKNSTSVAQMNRLLAGSYQKILQEAGRNLPVSVGGQTSKEGPRGNPPPDEVYGSMVQSKALGAIGECFFAWDGTLPEQWDAIQRFNW